MHHAEVMFQNNTIQINEYNPKLKRKTISDLLPKNLERHYSCPVAGHTLDSQIKYYIAS